MGYIAETAVLVKADTKGFHSQAQAGIMGSIAKIGAGAAGALGGLAIGKALFLDPIKSAGDFQQSLNVLQATSHATDARMKQISATAMKLGADTKLPAVSASDAANAMLELAKGGFTAKQSMEGARGVLLLSTAAQIDGATAATMVADGLHAFGLRAKDAGMLVDDFAGAANASTASMSEVGQSLQQSGQAFHQLGIPVGDAATAIAAMANAGIKGSDAGTSLKTMLQRLNPQTKKAKEAMADMGVSAFDGSGKFVGMRKVIEQMSPKLRAMTQEQRSSALSTIFGSDASRAAGIILGQTTEQWDKQHKAVTKAGQAQALADAQTKGFKGAMAALRSTVETIQLQIGLKLIPVLTTLAKWLAENLPRAVDIASQAFEVVGPIIAEAFDIARSAIEKVISVVSELIGWFNRNRDVAIALASFVATLAAGYIAYQIALLATRAALALATAAQWLLNAAMTANPIGIAIVAIAALVAALVLLYQRSQTARTIMNAAFDGIKQAASAVFGYITNTIIPGAIAAWNRFGPSVVAVLQQAASAIRTVVQAIATIVRTIIEQIRAHWDQIWSVMGPMVKTQLEVARIAVTTVLNIIAGVIRLFAALLRGDWSAAWNALKGIVSDALGGALAILRTSLTGMVQVAKALAVLVGNAIGNGVKAGLSALEGLAGDLIGKLRAAVSEAVGAAMTAGASIGRALISGILGGLGGLASSVGGKVKDGLLGAVKFAGGGLIGSGPFMFTIHTVGKPMAEGVLIGFEQHIKAQQPRVAKAIADMAEKMNDATKKELPGVAKGFQEWATTAKAAFDSQVDAVVKRIDANFTKAQARLDQWKAKLTPAEFQLATQRAAAEVAKVRADVAAAAAALESLPAKQAAAWSQLLAQQKANMDALRGTLQSTTDDALLSGNTFAKGMTKNASDPLAVALIAAQKGFDSTKALFDQGLVSQAEFIAAANVLDDAKIAAQEDSNATTLLDQYNTWQTALLQQTNAGAAITAQQAADAEAQQQAQAGFDQETLAAQQGLHDAQAAADDFFLQKKAEKERAAKDALFDQLSNHLKAMHDRTLVHLGNVQHAWDLHYDKLKDMASTSGKSIGDDLAAALRASIPTVSAAAAAVALVIQQHLKVKSPTEKGPMSDLDSWWSRLGSTLVSSFDGSQVQSALTAAVMPPNVAGTTNGQVQNGTGPAAGYSLQRVEMLLERIEKHTQTTAQKPEPELAVHVGAAMSVDASTYRARR